MYPYATAGEFGIGKEDEDEKLDVFGNGGDIADDLGMGQLTARAAKRLGVLGQYVQEGTRPVPFSDPGRFAGVYSNLLTPEDLFRAQGGRPLGANEYALDWESLYKRLKDVPDVGALGQEARKPFFSRAVRIGLGVGIGLLALYALLRGRGPR